MNKNVDEKKRYYLSIVIPAYNEAKRIGSTLEHILEFMAKKEYDYEIIVVDDGSKDNTCEVVKEKTRDTKARILVNEVNQGKGYTVSRGVLAAEGEYVLFSDADESTPISELDKLMEAVKQGYDIAIGSRAVDRSTVEVPQAWLRDMMGRTFNLIVRAVVIGGIKDTQCGFKLFRAEAAKKIFPRQRITGFSFDVESLFLARKFGYKIVEIPVRWINSPASTVHPIRDSARMFRDVLRIRWMDLKGLYNDNNPQNKR